MADKPSKYWWIRHLWALVLFPTIGAITLAGVAVFKGWLHQRVGFDSEGNPLTKTAQQAAEPHRRGAVSALDVYRVIAEDLQRRDPETGRRCRYLTLLHRYHDPE